MYVYIYVYIYIYMFTYSYIYISKTLTLTPLAGRSTVCEEGAGHGALLHRHPLDHTPQTLSDNP